eukprot:Rmarinus@m.9617
MRGYFWVILIFSLAMAPAVTAWGNLGHELVAAIGDARLNDNAKAAALRLLPEEGGSLAAIATWADDFREDFPWSFRHHFVNTADYQCGFNYLLDCKEDDCVVGAINNYTSILHRYARGADVAPSLATDALKFVVHFMGDIHQPMHVSFASDEGGNLISVDFMGHASNLHGVWDYDIIDQRLADMFSSSDADPAAAYLTFLETRINSSPWIDYIRQWEACPLQQPCAWLWAEESAKHACDAHTAAAAVDYQLEEEYYQRFTVFIDERISMAGVRLATLLNSIFPEDGQRGPWVVAALEDGSNASGRGQAAVSS